MNVITVIGRLAFDPELRFTDGGKPVARFRIAVERLYKKDAVSYFDCETWNKPAENLCNHKKKGDELGVTGELVSEPWQDKDGNKRQGIKIVASRIDWLRNKQDSQSRPAEAAPVYDSRPMDSYQDPGAINQPHGVPDYDQIPF